MDKIKDWIKKNKERKVIGYIVISSSILNSNNSYICRVTSRRIT